MNERTWAKRWRVGAATILVLAGLGCGDGATPPSSSLPPATVGAPIADAQFITDCADPFVTYLSVPSPDDPSLPSGQQLSFSMAESCDECHLTYSAEDGAGVLRWFATCTKEDGSSATNHVDWPCVTACANTDGCDVYNKNGDLKVNQNDDWCKANSCSKNFCDASDAGKDIKVAAKVFSNVKKADKGIMSCVGLAEGDEAGWHKCVKTIGDSVKILSDLFTGGERNTYDVDCQTPFASLDQQLQANSSDGTGLGAWTLANLDQGETTFSFAASCSSCAWSIAYAADLDETPAKLDATCTESGTTSTNDVHIDMSCFYSCALTPECDVLNQDGELKVNQSQEWCFENYCSTNFCVG